MKALLTKTLFASLSLLTATISLAVAQPLPDTIRFGAFGQGYGQPYGTATLAIAHVKGFIADEFKDTPVKFEWSYPSGTGPAINEAIANGQLDFAQYGGLPNIIGRANGLPTRIIQSYGVTNIIAAARSGLPINSFKDIKGRRVTISKGTILHWAFLKALEANGLTLKDVTVVDLKTADQLAALAAGSVDVSIGTTSLLPLEDKGIVKIFYNSKNGAPKAAGFGGITVTEGFRAKYPEATQRVSRGLVRAGEWLSREENREEALQIWAKSGTPYDALRRDYEGQSLKIAFSPLIDDFLIEQYRDATQFSKEEKLIRNDIDLQQWLVPEYLNKSLLQLGLERYWPRRSSEGSAIN
jgi:sulfonate transport system substrate-binding protein